jgi:hypothetical protein
VVRTRCVWLWDRTRGYSRTVPAIRKLGPIELEQLVAERGAGRSLRQIAVSLGLSHSTLSRRIRSDVFLRARIRAAERREARRARDRERKREAKVRRENALASARVREPERRSPAATFPMSEQEPLQQLPECASEETHVLPSRTRPHGRRDELRLCRRILLDRSDSFEARELALETLGELLDATRSNGSPAHMLRLGAAMALLENPAVADLFAPPRRARARSGARR